MEEQEGNPKAVPQVGKVTGNESNTGSKATNQMKTTTGTKTNSPSSSPSQYSLNKRKPSNVRKRGRRTTKIHKRIIKEGYLLALGQRGKQLKKRFFRIKDNFLHFFLEPTSLNPEGVIPLEGCEIENIQDTHPLLGGMKNKSFDLIACKRSYNIVCADEKEKLEWIVALQKAAALTIESFYTFGDQIGRGAFSKVFASKTKDGKKEYAIKVIEKVDLSQNRQSLLTEIKVLKMVNHDNVLGLAEIFETKTTLYIVMELLSGGELFDRILEKGTFSEQDAAKLIKSIIEAISYLHSLGIIHRDIKPENLLYTSKAEDATVKLADFGLSKFLKPSAVLKTACGTPGYVAPEILGFQVDDPELFEQIQNEPVNFDGEIWDAVSKEAKDFVRRLLDKNPDTRMTATEALEHTWLINLSKVCDLPKTKVIESMKKFNARRKFRQGIMNVITTVRFNKLLGIAKKKRSLKRKDDAEKAENGDEKGINKDDNGSSSRSSETRDTITAAVTDAGKVTEPRKESMLVGLRIASRETPKKSKPEVKPDLQPEANSEANSEATEAISEPVVSDKNNGGESSEPKQ
eukprot:g3813.t1